MRWIGVLGVLAAGSVLVWAPCERDVDQAQSADRLARERYLGTGALADRACVEVPAPCCFRG